VSLEERVKEGKCSIGLADVPAAAAAMGYGAIKYADLKQNPASDYQFSYDRWVGGHAEGGL
jgi:arginyl-tRNA synthetase